VKSGVITVEYFLKSRTWHLPKVVLRVVGVIGAVVGADWLKLLEPIFKDNE
jgi:hypothetical protein